VPVQPSVFAGLTAIDEITSPQIHLEERENDE
jgi:hypothetical protein